MSNNETCALLIKHFQKYPLMQIQDIFKFLHQSSFGCEHLVSSEEKAVEYIKEEYSSIDTSASAVIEKLDGEYSRVHLSCIGQGLSAELLGKYFCLSARIEPDGEEKLKQKLQIAEALIEEGLLPFSLENFRNEVSDWEKRGFSAVRHSEAFRKSYKPAYRVISDKYAEQISELIKIKSI